MWGKITADAPYLTIDNFEDYLASDDTLVHFLNDFLSLPSFLETLIYNKDTGVFEVVSDEAESLSRKIRSALRRSKSKALTDPTELAVSPMLDNHYTVVCLDREDGVQWIIKERLPLFIQSDCYFEYRLAKLLSQWDPHSRSQKEEADSTVTREPRSPSPVNDESEALMKLLYVSLGQASVADMLTMAKEKQPPLCRQSVRTPVCSLMHGSLCSPREQTTINLNNAKTFPQTAASSGQGGQKSCHNPACFSCIPGSESYPLSSSLLDCESFQEPQSPQQELTVYLTEAGIEPCHRDSNSPWSPSGNSPVVEHLAASLVEQVLRDVVTKLDVSPSQAPSDCSSLSQQRAHTDHTGPYTQSPCDGHSASQHGRLKEEDSGGSNQENDLEIGFRGGSIHGSKQQGLQDFKEFLRGTPGEKLLCLWMDLERLKTIQNSKSKNRHLIQMRSRYLLRSGKGNLSVELLSRLGLATPPCWREEKLCGIQPCVTEALLFYWGPRFFMAQVVHEEHEEDELRLWRKRQLRPPSGIDPNPRYITLYPLRPYSCVPINHPPDYPQPGDGSPVLGGRRMEHMLQALHVDSRAGFFFTQFCEHSGNQLWENAIHFWCDLQQYHQLFYQDGLDPYRVQRQAQLLYSTYLCSAAKSSIGVDEDSRRSVYACLTPPFEELFDGAEEYTLTLLLEPWTLLITRDKETYERVDLWEENRQVDTEEYRELQALYEESVQRLKQAQECSPPSPPPEVPRSPDAWADVPEQYRGYRLGSLLRHRLELQHFLSFLRDNSASIHLTCWLDIEQFRRIPHKDKTLRVEKSKDIKNKYLNRKYFFGPDSPATREQQEEVLHLAGGWGRLLHECLANPVLMEIQSVIRSYIERTWLPAFLTTPEFTERQKLKAQVEDVGADQVYRRSRKKREAWKQHVEGTWMTSSKEILAFRRVLLNPVTCHQFQRFVSLKGDFLENDVFFWLEVQKYKDLCHSHCEEATIQQKVTTIINCFISSSIPPALQIDISPEQARHILERRRELGPYVFREAQMSVFSELFKLWPQFLAFRSSVEDEEVLPELENRRVKQRAKVLRRRRKEEEDHDARRAQEKEDLFEDEEGSVHGDNMEDQQKGGESRELPYSDQQISWSYSKYMVALEREEVLLRRQAQLGNAVASFSTGTDSSSGHSLMSEGSRRSRGQRPVLPPRTDNVLQ